MTVDGEEIDGDAARIPGGMWAEDSFGNMVTTGDTVQIVMGVYINRTGTILGVDTVGGEGVVVISIANEGVRMMPPGQVQFVDYADYIDKWHADVMAHKKRLVTNKIKPEPIPAEEPKGKFVRGWLGGPRDGKVYYPGEPGTEPKPAPAEEPRVETWRDRKPLL